MTSASMVEPDNFSVSVNARSRLALGSCRVPLSRVDFSRKCLSGKRLLMQVVLTRIRDSDHCSSS
jgi:hypothetical protein